MKPGTGPISVSGSLSALPPTFAGLVEVINPVLGIGVGGAFGPPAPLFSGAATFTPQLISLSGSFGPSAPMFSGLVGSAEVTAPTHTVSGDFAAQAPRFAGSIEVTELESPEPSPVLIPEVAVEPRRILLRQGDGKLRITRRGRPRF